jgi:hypothetical protein
VSKLARDSVEQLTVRIDAKIGRSCTGVTNSALLGPALVDVPASDAYPALCITHVAPTFSMSPRINLSGREHGLELKVESVPAGGPNKPR